MSLPGLLAPRVRVLFDPQKLDGADSYAVETCWNYEEEECLWRWCWRRWQWWLIMMMSMIIMYLLTAYSQCKNKLHDGIIVTGAVSPWLLFLGICKSEVCQSLEKYVIIPKQPGLTFAPSWRIKKQRSLIWGPRASEWSWSLLNIHQSHVGLRRGLYYPVAAICPGRWSKRVT